MTPTEEHCAVRTTTQAALADNLGRVKRVSRQTLDEPGSITQEALAERTGIARSTINKLLNNPEQANPDLNTLCRLAKVLNIPPAFLLMTSDDWSRMTSALNGLAMYLQSDSAIKGKIQRTLEAGVAKPPELADVGLQLAQAMGVMEYLVSADAQERTEQGIKAAVCLPNWREITNPDMLYVICALMGAATNIK
jgi:DNA-binding XRE family transcriptional regulator